MKFTDTHAHLDSFENSGEISEILRRARAAGVERIIACSTNPSNWRVYEKLARENPDNVFWQAGIHPSDISPEDDLSLDALSTYFIDAGKAGAPVAIGEIGLDFYRLPSDRAEIEKIRARQIEIFSRQLGIAADLNLKVCVHARESLPECVGEIEKSGLNFENVVFHCYSGTAQQLRELNLRGARASFTGIITYKNSDEMRKAMLAQGLGMLMLETDCPYLAPAPFRGKPCEPSMLVKTAECAAELFGTSVDEIASRTEENVRGFFGI